MSPGNNKPEEDHSKRLADLVVSKPDMGLAQVAAASLDKVSPPTVPRACRRLVIMRKMCTPVGELAWADVNAARDVRFDRFAGATLHSLMFLDEFGIR